MTRLLAAARVVVLLLVGAVVGSAAVVVHGRTTGLLLALAATAATAFALPAGWSRRFPFGVSWCGAVALGSLPRGTGSYLVAGNAHGYVLLGGAFALLLFSVLTAVRRPSRPSADAGSDPPVS